jgi:hypothetical protein
MIRIVDVWSVIDEPTRYKQRYSPREIEVLQAVDHFRIRNFCGSGTWEVSEYKTYAEVLQACNTMNRPIIYAGAHLSDEKRYASLPRLLTSQLVVALSAVGRRVRPKLKSEE